MQTLLGNAEGTNNMTAIDLVNKIRRLTPQGKYVLTNVQAVALIKQIVAESGGKQ